MLWLLSQLTTAIGTVFMLALTFSPSIYNPSCYIQESSFTAVFCCNVSLSSCICEGDFQSTISLTPPFSVFTASSQFSFSQGLLGKESRNSEM